LSEELIDSLSHDETYGEKHRIASGEVSLAIRRTNPKHQIRNTEQCQNSEAE